MVSFHFAVAALNEKWVTMEANKRRSCKNNVAQQESMLSCIEKSSEHQVATIVHTMPNPEWLEQFNVVQ